MYNNIIALSDKVTDCKIAIEKAKLVIGMLADDYSFSEEKEEVMRERMMCEADKIVTYLFIALDYVHSTDAELKQVSKLLMEESEPKQETTESLLSRIESFKIPDKYDITTDDVKKIADKNNRALFETASNCFTAGFIKGQEFEKAKRKKVQA